jgi:hypothetical protein
LGRTRCTAPIVLERRRDLPSGSQFATPGKHATAPTDRCFESRGQTPWHARLEEQFVVEGETEEEFINNKPKTTPSKRLKGFGEWRPLRLEDRNT